MNPWFDNVFLPSVLAKIYPRKRTWLTLEQTVECRKNMKKDYLRADTYCYNWQGKKVEMKYCRHTGCGEIEFCHAVKQLDVEMIALEIKIMELEHELELFQNRTSSASLRGIKFK